MSTREDQILGGKSPIVTILLLSIGPFCSQVSNSVVGLVNTLWLRNAVSELSTSALATATTIDSLSVSFGFFFMTCATSQISSLFGSSSKMGNNGAKIASQVLCDLLRLCIAVGICLPAILLPLAKPLMKWFGADEVVVNLGFSYLLPIISCSTITSIYLLLCGCLQAEGRTFIFSIVQLTAMILNACVFNPLFLLVFKVGIQGSAFSIVLSQFCPMVCLIVSFFLKKFTVQPSFKLLISKPAPETWQALKTGSSALISAVSATLPSIFFQKFIGSGCENQEVFNVMMSMYNSYNKLYQIVVAIFLALTSGFLPSASYSFSSGDNARVLKLLFHTFWMVTVIALLYESIIFGANQQIARLFSSKKLFLERFKECSPKYWSTLFLCSWQYIGTTFLQATQKPWSALFVSFVTQLLMWPIFSFVFYYTKKDDEVRLFYAVLSNDTASILVCIPFVFVTIYQLVKSAKEINRKPGDELESIEQVLTEENATHIAEL